LPSATSDFVAVTVGDMIYIIGGQTKDGNSSLSMIRYDPIIDEFKSKAPMSAGRMRYGAAVVGTKIYVVGGLAVDDKTPMLRTTFIYDTENDSWAVGPFLLEGRSDHCAFAVGAKVYAVGGYTDEYVTLSSVEVMDTSATPPVWAPAPSLPEARGDVTCASSDGKGYAIGGYLDPTWHPTGFKEDVFEYDAAGNAAGWVNKTSMPVDVGDKAAVTLSDGSILVLGGETHARGARTQVATHTSLQYYPKHDTWVKKAPMPTARFRFGAAVDADGYVHAFGGHTHCETIYEKNFTDCPAKALKSHEMMFDAVHPDIWMQVLEAA
jgi:N-acetylneuraminic acid mutarotase